MWWLKLWAKECIKSTSVQVHRVHVIVSHLSPVASQIESRKVVWVAHTEVDDIHQVGRHVHNCRRREEVTQSSADTQNISATSTHKNVIINVKMNC